VASKYEWIKLILENSKVLISIIIFLFSLNGYNFLTKLGVESSLVETQKQVAEVATQYHERGMLCLKLN